MPDQKPIASVTIDQAVALMLNQDYVPEGLSVTDLTSAFLEEAEVNHYNAALDSLTKDEIASLNLRVLACESRHRLAVSLTNDLKHELTNPDSDLEFLEAVSNEPALTLESLANWAENRYGITVHNEFEPRSHIEPPASWNLVTIKLYSDYRIRYFLNNNEQRRCNFYDIGLMGKRKNSSNHIGMLLIGLSMGKKYPQGGTLENKHAAAICKLRSSLKKLTNIHTDPFFSYNEGDGWKPRFKLVDERNNADKRAKHRAVHVPLDDEMASSAEYDFDGEDDDASRWINENS